MNNYPENEEGFWTSGGPSDVVWTLTNGEDTEVDSHQGNIAHGGEETWYTTTKDVVVGDWTLNVDVTQGDQVTLNNEISITYVEGSESGINPRSA